ncbi:MAG TPA: aspartate-semialdehyde dehydrogenase [Bacteroidales bacterium]|nr:aspartate-semialdehyde dehydrogenase [Bacteroidales bacterium]HRZ76933.1 aspartate-semialdehyde dehydrogenase [Bacteroidales bacterium]
MKILVFGATGMVGRTMLNVLEERQMNFPSPLELIPVASERSAGQRLQFLGRELKVVLPEEGLASGAAIALFSAGASTSLTWAPRFAEKGTYVIDNSSAWRREAGVPLVVPEINAHRMARDHYLIANPNCSTIQLVAALAPLHRAYGLDRIVVSTYQSVTGSGVAGLQQLMDERRGVDGPKAYPHPIDLNLIPQGGHFQADGYTSEEDKLVFETRKILGDESIRVSPTVVRVPVKGGHSESVNVSFHREYVLEEAVALLRSTPGLLVLDDPVASVYPTPQLAEGRDEVFVGRIRRDPSAPKTLNLWIVSDNLRKGAATNAVQIAEVIAGWKEE